MAEEEKEESSVGAFFKSILPSEKTVGSLLYTDGKLDLQKLGGVFGAVGGAFGLFSPDQPPVGYQGSIPDYTPIRRRVPSTYDENRRPGSAGQRYFSDVQFAPAGGITAAGNFADSQVTGLEALNLYNPAKQQRPRSVISTPTPKPVTPPTQGIATVPDIPAASTAVTPYFEKLLEATSPFTDPYEKAYLSVNPVTGGENFAAGGIAQLKKGKYLDGSTDGMADEVPAMIDDEQPAALSDGEFVIPADVVSHLGNGNSDAGAKVLEDMMDRVRKARTNTTKQAPEIDPKKFLPA